LIKDYTSADLDVLTFSTYLILENLKVKFLFLQKVV